MSTSTYYSFIGTNATSQAAIDARRQAQSPFASSSNSSSSLNHYTSSSTPTPSTPSSSLTNNGSLASNNGSQRDDAALQHHNHHVPDTSSSSTAPTITDSQKPKLLATKLTSTDATLTNSRQHVQLQRLPTSTTFNSLESRSFRPFKSNDGYLFAMKEDLAEWLNNLYDDLELNTENFMIELDNGALLCRHANNVTTMGRNFIKSHESTTAITTTTTKNISTNNIDYDHVRLKPNNSYKSTSNRFQNTDSASNCISSLDSSTTNSSFNNNNNNNNSCSSHYSSPEPLSLSSPRFPLKIDWFKIKLISFKQNATTGTFFARDNICQFINWCRSLNILDCLLFETDDLVLRKNERSFILCLLEVARIGFKVGMSTPLIIQLEQEIDRAIENDAKLERQQQLEIVVDNQANEESVCNEIQEQDSQVKDEAYEQQQQLVSEHNKGNEIDEDDDDLESKPQVITNDLVSLHERVVELLNMCTCPTQFPMVRITDGKYRVGDKLVIFLRILRNHIMVRVGGGWDTLEHYFDKHDPCRCKFQQALQAHQGQRQFGSVSRLRGPAPHQSVPFINTQLNSSQRKNSSNFGLSNNNSENIDLNCQTSDSSLERPAVNTTRKLSGLPQATNRYTRRISSSVSMSWLPLASPNGSGNNTGSSNSSSSSGSNNNNNQMNSFNK